MRENVGLALSGGGFRATLFHLGVIISLRNNGQLSKITHISSVSGGSIIAAHLVLNWDLYNGDDEQFEKIISDLIKLVKLDLRGRIIRRIPIYFFSSKLFFPKEPFFFISKKSLTDLLQRYLKKELFHELTLFDLNKNNTPELFLMTTNITDGNLYSFDRDGLYNENTQHRININDFPIYAAVAASASFPALFSPIEINPENNYINSESLGKTKLVLTDGGVYDNLGIRKFQNLIKNQKINFINIFVSDASLKFSENSRYKYLLPLKVSLRAADIYSKRIYELENELASDPLFIKISITDSVIRNKEENTLSYEMQSIIPSIRTDFDIFSDLEIDSLIKHGICITRKSLKMNNYISNDYKNDTILTKELSKLNNYENEFENRKNLYKSKNRKLRLFSLKDRVTYFYFFILLLIPLLLFTYKYKYSLPKLNNELSSSIRNESNILIKNYSNAIFQRKDSFGIYSDGSILNNSTNIETWGSMQAISLLIKSINYNDKYHILNSLKSRFDKNKCKDIDNLHNVGWFTRPGLLQPQAEPNIWTGIAICNILKEFKLGSSDSLFLINKLISIQNLIDSLYRRGIGTNSNSIYPISNSQNLKDIPVIYSNKEDFTTIPVWYVFPISYSNQEYCIYTTTLGLQFLMDCFNSGLGWKGDLNLCKYIINNTISFFISTKKKFEKGIGWKENDNSNSIPSGLTFQVYSEILQSEKDSILESNEIITEEFITEIGISLAQLEYGSFSDYVGRIIMQNNENICNQALIVYLWRPWAIICCQLYIERLERYNENIEDIVKYKKILNSLIVENGKQEYESTIGGYTFVLSEMLYALSFTK